MYVYKYTSLTQVFAIRSRTVHYSSYTRCFVFVRAKYSNFFFSVHFRLLGFPVLYVQLLHALSQRIPAIEYKKTINFHFISLFNI